MDAKAQHYVPQFYLRNFAIGTNISKMKLWCFDKSLKKERFQTVSHIAHQTKFNDYINDKGNIVPVEKIYSNWESILKKALYNLCENPTLKTLEETNPDIAFFIAFQWLRTAGMRKMHVDILNLFNKVQNLQGKASLELDENSFKKIQAAQMQKRVKELANSLLNKSWSLIINSETQLFWTSDCPIFFCNSIKNTINIDAGFFDPGIEICIPLSPRIAIRLFDTEERLIALEKATPDVILINNRGQVFNSMRCVYSHENDFGLINELIERYPEISDPNRRRLTTFFLGTN